jgi:hypothetical protein
VRIYISFMMPIADIYSAALLIVFNKSAIKKRKRIKKIREP